MIKKILNIAYVGNYIPRACGIATFTTDLVESTVKLLSPKSNVFAIAVNDNEMAIIILPVSALQLISNYKKTILKQQI